MTNPFNFDTYKLGPGCIPTIFTLALCQLRLEHPDVYLYLHDDTTSLYDAVTYTLGEDIIISIHIKTIDSPMIVKLLEHEAVHVKQIKDGRLAFSGVTVIWEGKEWINSYYPSTEEFSFQLILDYLTAPWELEAYGVAHDPHKLEVWIFKAMVYQYKEVFGLTLENDSVIELKLSELCSIDNFIAA